MSLPKVHSAGPGHEQVELGSIGEGELLAPEALAAPSGKAVNTPQVVRNAIANYGRLAVVTVSTLLLTPLVLHSVGQEGLGLWILATSIGAYFGLADLGLTGAAVRHMAAFNALKDWEGLNRTISTSMTFYIGIAGAVGIATVIVAAGAPSLFHVRTGDLMAFRFLMVCLGLIGVVGFLTMLPIQGVIAAQRADALGWWTVANETLTTVITVVGLLAGGGLFVLGAAQLLKSILTGLGAIILCRRHLPQARFRPGFSRGHAGMLLSFAGFAALAVAAGRVIYASDAIVIATFSTLAAVGVFSVGLRAVQLMQGMVNAGVSVLGVFASEQDAYGNVDELGRMWMASTMWSLCLLIPLGTMLVLFGGPLVEAWVGPGFVAAGTVLSVLAVGHVVDLSQSGGFQVLMNSGHHRLMAIVAVAEAVVNVLLSILLIHPFGIVGVAIGTTLPMLLRGGIFFPFYVGRVTGVSLSRFARGAVWPAIIASVPAVALLIVYRLAGFPTGRWPLIALGIAMLLLAGAGVYAVCLSPTSRVDLRRRLRKGIGLPTRDAA